MKYIDSERLRAEIKFAKSVYDDHKRVVHGVADAYRQDGRAAMCDDILKKIDSLQQDETQVDKILCSQVWWEEQGWIMIPPDATIEGVDSLLRQVKKKLQQEQPVLPGIEESGIPGKDYIPVEWVDACEKYGKWKIVKQDQPELPGYDKALLEVKSKVDEIYEEASIGLSEYDSGLYNGIAETCMKLRGFIKARLDSDERLEVDEGD